MNEIGYSDWSDVVIPAITMQDLPHVPTVAPARIEDLTFGTQIGVSYQALTSVAAGGASILSYNLQIDTTGGGSGPWINTQGFASDNTSL